MKWEGNAYLLPHGTQPNPFKLRLWVKSTCIPIWFLEIERPGDLRMQFMCDVHTCSVQTTLLCWIWTYTSPMEVLSPHLGCHSMFLLMLSRNTYSTLAYMVRAIDTQRGTNNIEVPILLSIKPIAHCWLFTRSIQIVPILAMMTDPQWYIR